MATNPKDFLSTVTGLANAERNGSADKPFRLGTIDPAYTGTGNPKIIFDGETEPSGKGYPYASYTPQPGDRVVLAPVGNTYVILGAIGQGGGGAGIDPDQPLELNNYYRSIRTSTGLGAYAARVTGDTQDRFLARSDGRLMWGSGSAAQDTVLYRSGANALRTDDSLRVDGNLTVGTSHVITKDMIRFVDIVASSSLALTGSYQDIPGASQTFTTNYPNAVAVVVCTFFANTGPNPGNIPSTAIQGIINVDGSDMNYDARLSFDVTPFRITFNQVYRVTLASAGSHTIKMRARAVGIDGDSNPAISAGNLTRSVVTLYDIPS